MAAPEVLVLAGGISHEREVSLRSGRRVADALQSAGCSVTMIDPDASLFATLEKYPQATVWPVVHGASGEDGALLDLLRAARRRYVGPTPEAARLTWHKPTTKTLLARGGIAVAESVTLARETFRELGASSVLELVTQELGHHLVVKPARGGSAQGVSIVSSAEDLPRAMVEAFTYCEEALIERFVSGTEVGVTLIDRGEGLNALPPVEIVPLDGVYSFEARYNAGETTFFAPARVGAKTRTSIEETAIATCEILGLGTLARVDIIVDEKGIPYVLEANAIPGLTETSLAPLAIEAAGLDLSQALMAVLTTASA